MHVETAVESASAGPIPTEMRFGNEFTGRKPDGETWGFPEVRVYLEQGLDPEEPGELRVEYLGMNCLDVSIGQNDDGTWGSKHERPEAAAARVAKWLIEEASLNVEVLD